MTKEQFFLLADTVFDHDADQMQISTFEDALERYPEWMDEWVDQKAALHEALGLAPIQPSPNFTPSLTARWRAQRIKFSIQYWAPAALAAAAAAIGLIAVVQVISSPVKSATFGKPEAEAKLESAESIPFPSLREPLNR